MQDEQFRKTGGSGRASSSLPVRRSASSLFGAARIRRLLLAGFCLLTAFLFAGTAVFPGTYPLGIAWVSAAGGVLSAAAVTMGALLGSVRIPGAGGVYALVFITLFAVRILASVWIREAGSSSPGKDGAGGKSGGSGAAPFWSMLKKTRILLFRLLELEEEEGADSSGSRDFNHQTGASASSGASSDASSDAVVRRKMNAGTVLREHIRVRMALSACAALFAGAWSVVAGGYEYADLFGAVFSTLTTPLLTYLFYAASDRNMRASRFRELGVYALMMAGLIAAYPLRFPVLPASARGGDHGGGSASAAADPL